MPRFTTIAVLILLAGALSAGAEPDAVRPGATRSAATPTQSPDFLFGRPAVAVGLRFQWSRPRASSDIFAFVTEALTLSRDDFDAPGLALDVGFPLGPQLAILAGVEYGRARAVSEDRDLVEIVGGERLPIQQESTLAHVNLSGSLELALTRRGRAIGRYAWIPAPVTPYIGGGGGLLWYQFKQEGDFVDALDPEFPIFTAQLLSDGWTMSSHLFAGVDVRLSRRLLLTTEVRYLWANATMSQDFVDFEPIDLAGLRIAGGIQLLF